MVAWSILVEHAIALALVWAWVVLAGLALLPFLRLRIGWVGAPLLGVVYWTIALYAFPFAGGLDVAAGLIGVLAGFACQRAWSDGVGLPKPGRPSWATMILILGSLPYTTTLLFHYVPFGMDASMHTTAAALIARTGGLPGSYAPFAPELIFPPLNLGLPTVAAVVIRFGGETAAVMLACHHLTFTLLILATYLLLRGWTGRTSAALIAVVSVWTARASQASLQWGGFPTVMSIAMGLFAARLLWHHRREANWRLSLAAGAAIAAIPLTHGVGGGTWLYCVGPWIALAAVVQARSRVATIRGLAFSAMAAIAVLLIYRAAGSIDVQPNDLAWTQEWQQGSALLGEYPGLGALDFIRKDSGSFVVMIGWGACGLLVLRRRWLAALLLVAVWLMLAIVVANSRWWVLPASFLLYPERAIYWAAPLSAVGLALAWRALPTPVLSTRIPNAVASITLLIVAGYQQNQFYQKIVRDDFVNEDGWAALNWARCHLRPQHDFVQTAYNSTGSFLPGVAQIGCTGSHHHHFIARQVGQAYRRRNVTHVLLDRSLAPVANAPLGTVVFRNRSITILEVGVNHLAAEHAPRAADPTAK